MNSTNRFENIITNRVVGAEDVQAQAEALKRVADSLDNLSTKANKVNEHPGFNAFAEKIKEGIQNPLQAAGDIAEGFLKRLGPVGTGVAAVSATLAAAGVAGFKFAKELGELGDQVGDTAIRMGLTTKEVGQFDFAMKYAGGTMQSLEGIMRKLSDEVDGGGKNLNAIGVEFRELGTGSIRPTSQIILGLSERLRAMPDVYARNAAAVRILGRGALEVLPDLLALSEGVRRAKDLGLGATDEDLARWEQYHKSVTEAEALWERFARKVKEPLAAVVTVILKDSGGHVYSMEELRERGVNLGAFTPRTAQSDRDAARRSGFSDPNEGFERNIRQGRLLDFTGQIEERRRVDAAIGRMFGSKTLEEQLRAAEGDLSALTAPVKGKSSMEDVEEYASARRKVQSLKAQIEATKELESATKRLIETEKKSSQNYRESFFGDNPFGKLIAQRVGIAEQRDATMRQFAGRPDLQARADAAYGSDFASLGLKWAAEMRKWRDGVMKALESAPIPETERAIKELNDAASATGLLDADGQPRIIGGNLQLMAPPSGYISAEQQLRNARRSDQRNISLFGLRSALSGATAGDQVSGLYALRLQAAKEEEAALLRIADLKDDQVMREDAINQAQERRYEAAVEREYALLELQHRAVESIRGELGGAFDALTGGPGGMRQFLSGQARGLGRAAFANTATSLLTGSRISAQSTFGGTWLGDVFAAKGGDPVKAATDANTLATVENTRALMAFNAKVAMSASGGGGDYVDLARKMSGGFSGGGYFSSSGTSGDSGYTSDGWQKYSPENYDENGSYLGPGATGGSDPSAVGASARGGGGFNWNSAGRYGAAGAAAFGSFYSAAKSPSTKGKIGGAGSGLVSVGSALPPPAGPIVMGIGAGMMIWSAFARDPKEVRAEEMERDRASRAYSAPVGSDYQVDTYGRGYDYDYTGRMRPINVNIYAMDAQSFEQWGKGNPGAIASVVSHSMLNDEQIPATMSQVMP